MGLLESATAAGEAAVRAILADPGRTLLAVDFDGTLAPIVDDPERAFVDPDAIRALGRIAPQLGSVVVLTGRPVRTAVRLGRFAGAAGLHDLVVIGQYGVERWDAATGQFQLPPEPAEISAAADELTEILDSLGLDARIEHKGRALGVHTRTARDADAAFRTLAEPLGSLADRYGLLLERGKQVWELRRYPASTRARRCVSSSPRGARQVIFAGDDLGDLPAFEMVAQLRGEGTPGLLICSASQEEDALAQLSDLVVDGPSGVARWLDELAEALGG